MRKRFPPPPRKGQQPSLGNCLRRCVSIRSSHKLQLRGKMGFYFVIVANLLASLLFLCRKWAKDNMRKSDFPPRNPPSAVVLSLPSVSHRGLRKSGPRVDKSALTPLRVNNFITQLWRRNKKLTFYFRHMCFYHREICWRRRFVFCEAFVFFSKTNVLEARKHAAAQKKLSGTHDCLSLRLSILKSLAAKRRRNRRGVVRNSK